MSDIRDRIRKLLALGTSSNENERDLALRKAAELMLEHGIDKDDLAKHEEETMRGPFVDLLEPWHQTIAMASALLYGCIPVFTATDDPGFCFVGRSDTIEAAEETYEYLVDQVGEQYKIHLPRGLSKSERSEFRRTFKQACSLRVYLRVESIINDLVAHGTSKHNALVVFEERKLLAQRVQAELQQVGVKEKVKSLSVRPTEGARLGSHAGRNIQLQKEVK